VTEALGRMSLRAKVAQLVFPPVYGDGRNRDEALDLARAGVGGFVFYEGVSPAATAELVAALREASEPTGLPLVIAADQENGAGQVVQGATELPPQMAFAAAGSAQLMYEAARNAGREGRAMGFDLNCGPVADFTCPEVGPVEGGRSFGGDLRLMGAMLEATVRGYNDGGMRTTAKHFPSRGGVKPGPEQPWWCWIDKPADVVDAEDFAAFRLAIAAGVDFVMTEHIAVPSITGDWEPASVSHALVTGQLRQRLGFRGVITSDDLWYPEVCARFGDEEVAVLALLAGHDTLLKPKDPLAAIEHILGAIAEGRLSEERIDESLSRLAAFKAKLVDRPAVCPDEAARTAGATEHWAVAQRVADQAVTVMENRDGILPLSPERFAQAGKLMLISIAKRVGDPLPATVEDEVRRMLPDVPLAATTLTVEEGLDEAAASELIEAARAAGIVLLSASVQRNRLGDPAPLGSLKTFAQRLTEVCDVILVSHGNPYLVAALPKVAAGLTSWGEGGWFGNRTLSIASMLRVVLGDLAPSGKLPVAVGPYPSGHGLTWEV